MEAIGRYLCRSICRVNRSILVKRNIMTTPIRMERALEELANNPYYEKYAQKIAKLQQTSPEELLGRIEAQEEKKMEVQNKAEVPEQRFSSLLKPKKELSSEIDVDDEPLEKIMKIDLVLDKSVHEIKQIWEAYHVQKDVISATVPSAEFATISEQARKFPLFIFPLPRSQGYEFIMSEFRKNSVHFTPLICYQVHKENAPECLTIKHYTEFESSKGIVLMRGEFDKSVINGKEAQCLANQLQLFYSRRYPEKSKLLELFTTKPDEFKHTDLIGQIESLSL